MKKLVPELEGQALEIGSGTGAHVTYFAPLFKRIKWFPSEYIPTQIETRKTIAKDFEGDAASRHLEDINRVGSALHANVSHAVPLDASQSFDKWPSKIKSMESEFSLVYTCNTFHITPRCVGTGILRGAARALKAGSGALIIYGPFKIDGRFVTESNARFDAQLRAQNEAWGYWDTDEVKTEAAKCGLKFMCVLPMPANNFILHFRKVKGDE